MDVQSEPYMWTPFRCLELERFSPERQARVSRHTEAALKVYLRERGDAQAPVIHCTFVHSSETVQATNSPQRGSEGNAVEYYATMKKSKEPSVRGAVSSVCCRGKHTGTALRDQKEKRTRRTARGEEGTGASTLGRRVGLGSCVESR